MFPLASSRPDHRPRVGVFGIGLAAYWPQFSGLKEQLAAVFDLYELRIRMALVQEADPEPLKIKVWKVGAHQ